MNVQISTVTKRIVSLLLAITLAQSLLLGIDLSAEENKIAESVPTNDYDVFWDILENSYPMYDYLQYRGMNLESVKESFRPYAPVGADPYTTQKFYQSILDQIQGNDIIGHLQTVELGNQALDADYQYYCYGKAEIPDDEWIQMIQPIMEKQEVLNFYQLYEKPREKGEVPIYEVANNLYFSYHPDYNYAYVSIQSFMNEDPKDQELLIDFFNNVTAQGIGNIIIDVRGNLGGYNDYWMRNLVAPNITEPMEIKNYALYPISDRNKTYLDYYSGNSFGDNMGEPESEDELPKVYIAWDRIEKNKVPAMPAIVADDVKRLDGAFVETVRVAPSEKKALFDGKFYLLSDSASYSASEYFVSFSKRTGFATVVGTESGGDGSCVLTTYNVLPESGLLLRYNTLYGMNPDGSSSEEASTKPDVQIEAWQDALDVAVQMILDDTKKQAS